MLNISIIITNWNCAFIALFILRGLVIHFLWCPITRNISVAVVFHQCNVIIRCKFYCIVSAIISYLTTCSTESISFHYCNHLAVTTFLDLDFWIGWSQAFQWGHFVLQWIWWRLLVTLERSGWQMCVILCWMMIRYPRTVGWLLNVYKGKEGPLTMRLWRGWKLTTSSSDLWQEGAQQIKFVYGRRNT